MSSKTPNFDKALEEYFSKLELDEKGGQWRTCRFSGQKFYVRPEDIEFYKKIKVPLPTLSPNERRRRRIASQNNYTLFKKISAFSGKKIVSIYPPASPFKIFEHQIWYSDKWNPLEYGRDYDFSRPLFQQFYELQLAVPHPSLISDPTNVNSDFTNVSKNLKNCYLTFDQNKGEDLYYHQCCSNDRNCVECWALDNCDTCYECKFGKNLFKCFFCEECRNSMESYFLWDCRNCEHCFMSSNLRNKKYFFRNEYIGKEEYEKRLKEISLASFKELQKFRNEFNQMKMKMPRKPDFNEKSVNVFGDFIRNSKNIYFGLYIENSENLTYSEGVLSSKDSYDILGGVNSELCYELSNVWSENNFGSKFSVQIDNSREMEFCDFCRNCRNCFGCVGLGNMEFCVFNKKYTEDRYWQIVDNIKTKMLVNGEYGEFFPPQYLPFPYRATTASYFQGFWDFDNAAKYGYDVSLIEDFGDEDVKGEILNADDLPDDIKNVKDDILGKIIFDAKNNKKFRFIEPELIFYRKYSLPLPREHPAVRMTAWRNQFWLTVNFYQRKCPRCGKDFQTSYAPGRPEIVYCEQCYNAEIV